MLYNSYVYSDTQSLDRDSMRRDLQRDGAFVVRNLLDQSEIQRLRAIVKGSLTRRGKRFSLGKTQPNAAIGVPELGFVFSHPKILSIFRAIYGEENVMFTGHCDIHMNMLSGWHKDSGESMGGYFRGNYFSSPECNVHKVAIYLQDAGAKDGLTVRLGSHSTADIKAGREAKLDTKAGDIVIFDVRLNHAGQLPDMLERILKGSNALLTGRDRHKEDFAAINLIKDLYWMLIGRRDRLSIFFTYGARNSYTYDFSYFNILRQQKQANMDNTTLPPDLMDRLRSAHVTPFDFKNYKPA